MLLTTFSRQELIDIRAELQADYQHARTIGNKQAMQLAVSDMSSIDIELVTSNNIKTNYIKLLPE